MEQNLQNLETLKPNIVKDAAESVISNIKKFKEEVTAKKEIEEGLLKKEMLKEQPTLKKDIEDSLKKTEQALNEVNSISSSEINRTCELTLNQLQQAFQDKINTLRKGVRPKVRAEARDVRLGTITDSMRESMISTAERHLKSVAKDYENLVSNFSKNIKKQMNETLPSLEYLGDTDELFLEALDAIASANSSGFKLLRRYVENGAESLSKDELKSIGGYLSRLKGILPEQMANKMKFLHSHFHKNAFSILADFPSSLRGEMIVEIVEGPLWIAGRQYGDGCMLLTGPNLESAIIGLGELKAGFDKSLFEQLFLKSDKRSINTKVHFLDADKKIQSRSLTREFNFSGGESVKLTKPPIYVYGWRSQTTKKQKQFENMVKRDMQSGRELWKVELPFSSEVNERFAKESLKAAVNLLKDSK